MLYVNIPTMMPAMSEGKKMKKHHITAMMQLAKVQHLNAVSRNLRHTLLRSNRREF
jgi:hypothetical protein